MQTDLDHFIKDTSDGKEADAILRSCVHCGFCLATCPTYQLLGNELDSPRGRIYLMKQMLEGEPVTQKTQLHLDRCLTCRACETTCPSGVRYGRLVDISRAIVEKQVKRDTKTTVIHYMLRQVLPNTRIFAALLKMGKLLRPLLPDRIKKAVPTKVQLPAKKWPEPRHTRKMLVLDGCVQPALVPNINTAAAYVLDSLGISLIKAEQAGCCGGVSYHLNAQQEGLDYMRRNIDAWWPHVDRKIEAIVITASGCGVTVKEYGHLLRHDPDYAEKAAQISALSKDISEILDGEQEQLLNLLSKQSHESEKIKLSFHSPCTLQHGMQIRGIVEKILLAAGFELTSVESPHLCCGSAGTYSILQPELSQQLLENKVAALEAQCPEQIATANIGCLLHLQSGTALTVRHWIELLNEQLSSQKNNSNHDINK